MSRPTIANINLAALNSNLTMLAKLASNSKIVAVVKANAYGNGAVEVAKAIQQQVDMFAVAFVSEAIELRQSGISIPILILQGPHEPQDLTQGLGQQFIWAMHSHWQLDAYAEHLRQHDLAIDLGQSGIWLKFDTGMHRLGLAPNELPALQKKYERFITDSTVLMTHLACADDVDRSHANAQIDNFFQQVDDNTHPLCVANSATNIRFKRAQCDYVRLGIALYGSTPFQAEDNPVSLAAVMTLTTSVIALRTIQKGESVGYGATWRASRESTIATLAIGYADGYPRHAPTGTPAWCKGKIIPLVGRVSMDMLTFDVTEISDIQIGDSVQLWGDKLPINQVADHIGTIGYELMTRISARVPKVYSQ